MTRRLRGLTALTLAASLLSACPRAQREDEQNAYVVALEGRPANLDPRFALDAYSSRVLSLVMRGLTKIGPDGRPLPDLAASWQYSSPISLSIQLRQGEQFHDGTTITTELVAAALNGLLDPKLASPRAAALGDVRRITATSEHVHITLNEPFAPLLVGLAIPILHPGQITAAEISYPIGSGPFMFRGHNGPDELVLRRVPPAPPDGIKIVLFRTIADPTARTFALRTGDADLAQNNIPATELQRLAREPHLAVHHHTGWNVSYLGFNLKLEKFRDPRLRRAIALAINRRAIISTILAGAAQATDSLIPRQHWAYAPSTSTLDHSPDRARKLLDQAGLKHPDGDRSKPRLQLEYKTSTNPERLRIAEAIRADLRQVGIDVTIRSLEFGTFFEDIKTGNFEMYSLTWVGVIEPDLLHYALHSASMPPKGANRGFVHDPDLDALLDRGRQGTTLQARTAAYQTAQARLRETLVVVPLWISDAIIVQNRNDSTFAPLPDGSYRPLEGLTR